MELEAASPAANKRQRRSLVLKEEFVLIGFCFPDLGSVMTVVNFFSTIDNSLHGLCYRLSVIDYSEAATQPISIDFCKILLTAHCYS